MIPFKDEASEHSDPFDIMINYLIESIMRLEQQRNLCVNIFFLKSGPECMKQWNSNYYKIIFLLFLPPPPYPLFPPPLLLLLCNPWCCSRQGKEKYSLQGPTEIWVHSKNQCPPLRHSGSSKHICKPFKIVTCHTVKH